MKGCRVTDRQIRATEGKTRSDMFGNEILRENKWNPKIIFKRNSQK
jgi:hypothetical protein